MADYSKIVYNSKTIAFESEPLRKTFSYMTDVPRVVNVAHSGAVEVITTPRVDVTMSGRVYITSPHVRAAMYNLRDYALQGNTFTFSYDADMTVSTLLNGAASAGDSSVTVDSDTGVVNGRRYVVKDGPYHQVLTVNVAPASNVVTFEGTLDNAISDNAIFRDHLHATCLIRDARDLTIEDNFLNLPGHGATRAPFAWVNFRFL